MTRPPSPRITLISTDELSVRAKARREGAIFSAFIPGGRVGALLKEGAESLREFRRSFGLQGTTFGLEKRHSRARASPLGARDTSKIGKDRTKNPALLSPPSKCHFSPM